MGELFELDHTTTMYEGRGSLQSHCSCLSFLREGQVPAVRSSRWLAPWRRETLTARADAEARFV